MVYLQPVAGGQLGVARATESGGWHPWAPPGWAACTLWSRGRPAAIRVAKSDCMRIHAGTLGTLLREVGRSPSGRDQVFLPGKKTDFDMFYA